MRKQNTITRKMIRTILKGKQTNYAYDQHIRNAIEEVEQEYEERLLEISKLGESTIKYLSKYPEWVEQKLRKKGLRMFGDKN